MPEEVHETIVNDRLSQLLNREFGMDSRAERTTQRKRPDIIVSSKGLLIGIETSFQKDDAERDALERMNQRRADLVIALWLKTRYSGLSESELDTAIKGSTFDVKVLSETHERLDAYLPQKLRNRLSPEGWFTDIVLSDLKDFIDSAPEFLVKEEKVVELMSRVEEEIYFFVRSMSSVDRDGEHAKKFYDLFWKLYGLSLGKSPSEISDVIFGQVALSILLSSAFYEHARDFNPDFKDLDSRIQSDPINGLKQSLQDLLRIDYKVALRTTVEILTMLPISMAGRTKHLCQLGIRIAEDKALLRRDFAGRIYHRITGDLALKKGFATFYTEIPSAYLLTGLSFDALLENTTPEKQVKLLEDIKVGDFACGSGTLLTSSVHVVDRIASRLKFFDEVDVDLDHLIQHMIEDGVYGIDALRYASQITAINLALISPSNLRKQNVYSVHLGYKKDSNFTWLGSLELLKDTESFAGLLAWIEGGLKGAVEKVSVEDIQEEISLPAGFDLIIMNPPFTRATGRSKKIEAGRNAFFGFIADEVARGKVKQSYELIRDDVRSSLTKIAEKTKDFPPDIHNIVIRKNSDLAQYLGVGQAGEGLIFLYMGYRLVKKDGVIGFVVPRSILAGVHWFLSRTLLASKFHVKYVIVSSDPNGYNFSESTSLSESLLVAQRKDTHDSNEETVFVNLLAKPKGALEAVTLADKIKGAVHKKQPFVYGNDGISAILNVISRNKLLEHVDNWNRFLAVSDVDLSNEILSLVANEEIKVGATKIPVKLVKFTNLIDTMGVNRRGYMIEAFALPVRGGKVDRSKLNRKLPNSYPMVCGGESDLRIRMSITHNAYVMRANRIADTLIPLMSRLLVPYRIRWDTARVTVMCSEQAVLSNMFFMTKLSVSEDKRLESEKALAVWLNSVWGILTILANREETEGAFSGLNIGNWRLLPVIDVRKMSKATLKDFSNIFDRFCKRDFPRMPEQFSSDPAKVSQVRFELDLEVLEALSPEIDRKQATEELLKLYGRVEQALLSWIGGSASSSDGHEQTLLR